MKGLFTRPIFAVQCNSAQSVQRYNFKRWEYFYFLNLLLENAWEWQIASLKSDV